MAAALYLMENQALPNGKNVIPKANTKENKSHKRRMKYILFFFFLLVRYSFGAARSDHGRATALVCVK